MGTTSSCKYLVFTNCTGKQLFGDAEAVLPICALLPSAKGNFFVFRVYAYFSHFWSHFVFTGDLTTQSQHCFQWTQITTATIY